MATMRMRRRAWWAAGILVGLVVLFAAVWPRLIRARAQGSIAWCPSNLRCVHTALEMYARDHQGAFPPTLADLVPRYLKRIPECPRAGRDTYSRGYVSAPRPEAAFTIVCVGHHHRDVGAPPNYPQYTSLRGLVER